LEEKEKNKVRLSKKVFAYFLRMNIARKMYVGYISLLALLFIVSFYTLTNLNRLNLLNRSILEVDVPIIQASDQMLDEVLAQESYIRRYALLDSPEILKLFWEKDSSFEEHVKRLGSLNRNPPLPLEELSSLHKKYSDALIGGAKGLSSPGSELSRDLDKSIKVQQESIVALLKGMAGEVREDQNKKTTEIADIGGLAFKISAVLCLTGFLFSVAFFIFITVNISGAINKLKLATQKISEGDFDYRPDIQNKDEIGDLAASFIEMAGRLKKLEEMYTDASPLTRLPGGIAVENIVKKRLKGAAPIAFCLMDLDNFKAYNDNYGYAKGNEMIIATANIIEKASQDFGVENDFVGHIGGDDFVLVTDADSFDETCENIIKVFDREAPGFYNEDDRKRGHIVAKDRQGNTQRFPLASLSIAVVTNRKKKLESHLVFGEIAAELKEYAKSMPGSVYVVDHRRNGVHTSGKVTKSAELDKNGDA